MFLTDTTCKSGLSGNMLEMTSSLQVKFSQLNNQVLLSIDYIGKEILLILITTDEH